MHQEGTLGSRSRLKVTKSLLRWYLRNSLTVGHCGGPKCCRQVGVNPAATSCQDIAEACTCWHVDIIMPGVMHSKAHIA